MKNLEKAIILALHPECKTWEEACNKEQKNTNGLDGSFRILEGYVIFPISLPRVMQALKNKNIETIENSIDDELGNLTIEKWFDEGDFEEIRDLENCKYCILENPYIWLLDNWKLTENKKDLNLEDQTEETREELNKLFNV